MGSESTLLLGLLLLLLLRSSSSSVSSRGSKETNIFSLDGVVAEAEATVTVGSHLVHVDDRIESDGGRGDLGEVADDDLGDSDDDASEGDGAETGVWGGVGGLSGVEAPGEDGLEVGEGKVACAADEAGELQS